MAKLAKIFEAFSIKDSLDTISPKVRDHMRNMVYDSAKSSAKMGLLSEVAVTHGGIVNGNFGYYKPESLKASVPSWTKPFEKPVLRNHDMHAEPLGRNIGAVWVPSVPVATPNFKNSIANRDYSYRGLGHLQCLANINDPEAVSKVMDGRYLTVSVSGETDTMECSICHKNWITDGHCEHRFGKEYTDEDSEITQMAYWIGGGFLWDEWSFVNAPADPFALIVNREVSGDTKDSTLEIYNYKDRTSVEQQIVDAASRMFKMYAINDSLNSVLTLDDSTTVEGLYKLYGARLIPVQSNINALANNTEKGAKTVADNVTPTAPESTPAENKPVPVAPTPVVAPVAAETPVVSATPVAVTPVVPPVETPVANSPEVPAATVVPKVEPTTIAAPPTETVVTPAPAVVPAPQVVTPVASDSKVNELTTKNTELTDENRSLVQKLAELQAKVRDERIAKLLDLKISLGLETYVTDEDRKVAVGELQKRSLESIEDSIKDLEKLVKTSKQVKPTPIGSMGDEVQESLGPVDDQLRSIRKQIDNMSPVQLGALFFSGKHNPRVER